MNYSPFVIDTLTVVMSLLIPAAFITGLFKNVTLRTIDGTTQIDHIFVSRFGIFVVETNNMSGWIFGSEKQDQWTQKIYKNSYKFQNPLRQNYKHVKTLQSILGVPLESIRSVC